MSSVLTKTATARISPSVAVFARLMFDVFMGDVFACSCLVSTRVGAVVIFAGVLQGTATAGSITCAADVNKDNTVRCSSERAKINQVINWLSHTSVCALDMR